MQKSNGDLSRSGFAANLRRTGTRDRGFLPLPLGGHVPCFLYLFYPFVKQYLNLVDVMDVLEEE